MTAAVNTDYASELLRRRKAKESLTDWMRYRQAPYKPALHHKMLIAELEMVERGIRAT